MFVLLGKVDGVGGHNLHDGLGDTYDSLHEGYKVVHILPHGEQVWGHCSLQSLLGFLLLSPLQHP